MKKKLKRIFAVAKETATESKKQLAALLVAISAVAMLAVSASASANTTIDWSTVLTSSMMDGIITSVLGVVPIVIPVAVALIAIKLGIRLVRSQLK